MQLIWHQQSTKNFILYVVTEMAQNVHKNGFCEMAYFLMQECKFTGIYWKNLRQIVRLIMVPSLSEEGARASSRIENINY